jgi:ABC-2 type transport system ATP-binding protein
MDRESIGLSKSALAERGRDRYQTYSQGMRQRLGIAAALLNDPPLLLLDEPANGLDPAGIADLRRTFRELAAAGKTVFVSSHVLPEIEQLADLVAIIDHGRLVRHGRLSDLLAGSGQLRIRVQRTRCRARGDPRGIGR